MILANQTLNAMNDEPVLSFEIKKNKQGKTQLKKQNHNN